MSLCCETSGEMIPVIQGRMMRNTIPLLLLSILSGCAAVQRQAQDVNPQQVQRIFVKPYRMSPAMVPVSREGATLRSVMCDAYDIASQQGEIAASYLINQREFTGLYSDVLENISDGATAIDELALAGEKAIILIRGSSRMIVHEDLVYHTDLGSVRVLPGDQVVSLPLKSIGALYDDSLKKGQFALRMLGKDEKTLPLPTLGVSIPLPKPTLSVVSQNFVNYGKSELHPNVVVVNRQVSGMIDTIVMPCGITSDAAIPPIAELMESNRVDIIGSLLEILDGDVVEFTRLESIPIIAEGMTLPLPPRVGGSSPMQDVRHCLSNPRLNSSGIARNGQVNASRLRSPDFSAARLGR